MSILSWIAAGVVAGLVVGFATGRDALMENVIVGIVGSIIGGWLFVALTGISVVGFHLPGAVVALVGAVLLLAIAKGLTRGRATI